MHKYGNLIYLVTKYTVTKYTWLVYIVHCCLSLLLYRDNGTPSWAVSLLSPPTSPSPKNKCVQECIHRFAEQVLEFTLGSAVHASTMLTVSVQGKVINEHVDCV